MFLWFWKWEERSFRVSLMSTTKFKVLTCWGVICFIVDGIDVGPHFFSYYIIFTPTSMIFLHPERDRVYGCHILWRMSSLWCTWLSFRAQRVVHGGIGEDARKGVARSAVVAHRCSFLRVLFNSSVVSYPFFFYFSMNY